jgi:serine/threonine protein kinase
MNPGFPPEGKMAEALASFLDRQAREERPSADELLRQFPELAGDIETLTEIDLLTSAPSSALPETLSGLRVLGEIGSGGMGRVLLAEDERLGRKVAIKTLHPRYLDAPELRTRFMQEARAMARLNHPNIVRIYGLGAADEEPHFVMEYLEGAPLTDAASALNYQQKADLMRKVALAVAYLHKGRVIHRDLKPRNILVDRNLEPKLLDFGLALETESGHRLTQTGLAIGTPDYESPEQASASVPLDARSDIFSLGVVLYEMLTGTLPFRASSIAEQLQEILKLDPVLPRRIVPDVPGELQNICLKAMEKDPGDRYASAREMAADLERFLAGEPVLAIPVSYSRMLEGKIEQHLRELESWKDDRIVTDSEYDGLRKGYGRLVEREDSWIMETRHLSFQQVSLYLGGWVVVIGTALIVLFRYRALQGIAALLVCCAALAPTAWIGIRWWRLDRRRISVAFLLAFCLLLPVTLVVGMNEFGLFTGASRGRESLELFSKMTGFRRISNAQLWWAILFSLPVFYWLRRFTRSTVFSLVLATFGALLGIVSLLRMGLIEWLDQDPGKPYLYLIPIAALFLAVALVLERLRQPGDSRYFYPFFVAFTYASLTGLASFHEPLANWLKSVAPWTRGQHEYLFLGNAVVYFALQWLFEAPSSPQLRAVAKVFRFSIPGHVLIPLLVLGLAAQDRKLESRIFEWLLPAAALAFIFGSIPKQMKNFFASGLIFLAIGLVRLQQDLFKDHALWPACLLVAGLLLMLGAARFSPLKMTVARWLERAP